jgi:hypothetical protein
MEAPGEAGGGIMIILGVILLVIGYILGISIIFTIGMLLVASGSLLALFVSAKRAISRRS